MKITIDGITNPFHIDNQTLGKIIVDHEEPKTIIEDLEEKIVVDKDEFSDLCATFRGKDNWVKIKRNPLNPNKLIIFKGHINRHGDDINEGRIACLEIIPEN